MSARRAHLECAWRSYKRGGRRCITRRRMGSVWKAEGDEGVRRTVDILVESLVEEGTKFIFALSGNQNLPVFDACIDVGIQLVHVRHEAAAVHMADAWGRLTGEPGVALVAAGPGFLNALSPSYVAQMAEAPLVILSGQAPSVQVGRGAFQEMPQGEIASHVTKASWTLRDDSLVAREVKRAFQLARSGRPGPVHLALPVDMLEKAATSQLEVANDNGAGLSNAPPLGRDTAIDVLDSLQQARRPLVLGGPPFTRADLGELLCEFEERSGVPCLGMESPRGIDDPSLGALSEVLPRADVVLLVGKRLDYTLRFGDRPAFDKDCRFIHLDPDVAVLDQTKRNLGASSRLILAKQCDAKLGLEDLLSGSSDRDWAKGEWRGEVRNAVEFRPPEWRELKSQGEALHPVEVCQRVQEMLDSNEDTVLISDGGEFGQWAQACISAPHRVINGPSGGIGGGIPFALAARLAFPEARVVATLGDGTFGFHGLEFDTAVRYRLPFVAVVGNDSGWNSERVLQRRKYGSERLIGCDLLPSRYGEVAVALGGWGRQVNTISELGPALEDAFAASVPACVNVAIEPQEAPLIRRRC